MKVLFVQPYLAEYRVPLYDELDRRLRARGDSLRVVTGHPDKTQAQRDDSATAPWHQIVGSGVWKTPIGEFKHRKGLGPHLASCDVCVMELDVGNLNAWSLMASARRPKVVLWGHGKSFTRSTHPAVDRIKTLLAQRADHVMTYTDSGRQHLLAGGLSPEAVTTVGNSTDTESLRAALRHRLERSLAYSESFHKPVEDRVIAMFVGGIDEGKRIPFLLAAARHAHALDSRFLLLVAGSGSQAHLVREAAAQDCVAWIPSADRFDFADMAAVASMVWMPGRVGLIAVDALSVGIPVMTTNFAYHAPEFDLLTPGRDVAILSDEPAAFAYQALHINLRKRLVKAAELPSIRSMANDMLTVLDANAN